MTLTPDRLQRIPVFGIAGNFAEHLSQAGEDADFVQIKTEDAAAPKGIFPIYIPSHASYLGTYPLSSRRIQADFSQPIKVQVEPEISILFDAFYDNDHHLTDLQAKAFSAFNDCSIRRPNARKISEKKNWGTDSTGLASDWIDIDRFDEGGILDDYHIASFIQRNERVERYGMNSPVLGYSYFYQTLKHWMVRTFNQQCDQGPLENLAELLAAADYPAQIIVTLGATRYAPFGETGYLKPGDRIGVFVYDKNSISEAELADSFAHNALPDAFKGSALVQSVSQA
ncbi:MAG: DUF5718 family protein [Hydrogenovibrio sp.]